MTILKPGFYKFEPIKFFNDSEKPRFSWVDKPDEDILFFTAMTLNKTYYHGAKWSYVSLSDPEFIDYVNRDLIKVQKDLDKLANLKNNLLKIANKIQIEKDDKHSNLSEYYSDSAEHQKIYFT